MKKLVIFFFSLLIITTVLEAKIVSAKKVLYINSYHSGLVWSDGIENAIKLEFIKSKMTIDLEVFYMDTKRITDESYKKEIAKKAKKLVESYKPDVLIVSDDNAMKYVVVTYFMEANFPIVFCGVNDSSKKYGMPVKNITGMEEVQLIKKIVDNLKKYSNGMKVGLLDGDVLSAKLIADFIDNELNQKVEKRLVSSINDWKKSFLELQEKVDIILIGSNSGIKDFTKNEQDIKTFIVENTKVPTGTWSIPSYGLALLSFVSKPDEQGQWAAKTALEILNGKKVEDIKIVRNKEARIFINATLAKKLNIIFPFDLIDYAEIVK